MLGEMVAAWDELLEQAIGKERMLLRLVNTLVFSCSGNSGFRIGQNAGKRRASFLEDDSRENSR